MINFEEELKKFKPSLEIDQAEEAIYKNDLRDVTDILEDMMKEVKQAEEAIYSNDLKDISDIVLQMTQDLRNTGSILDNAVSVRARRR